jgi:hypothetical protein
MLATFFTPLGGCTDSSTDLASMRTSFLVFYAKGRHIFKHTLVVKLVRDARKPSGRRETVWLTYALADLHTEQYDWVRTYSTVELLIYAFIMQHNSSLLSSAE